MATVNSLALELIKWQGESSDDSDYVSEVETQINNSLDEIAIATNYNTFKTRATIPTVIAQAQYTLPAGGREIIQLRYLDNGEPLHFANIQELARRGIKLEDAGRARYWLEDGTTLSGSSVLLRIRLAPVPDATLNIEAEYYYHPSEVASASHLPVQDQLIVLIKDRVRAYMLEQDQKYDAADRCQRRYENNLGRIVRQENHKVGALNVMKHADLANRSRRLHPILDPSRFPGQW